MDFSFIMTAMGYVAVGLVVYLGGGFAYWFWMRMDPTVDRQWDGMTSIYKTTMVAGWPIIAISTFFFWLKNRKKKQAALAAKSRSRAHARTAVNSSKKRAARR
ncbi:hypothetical protein [Heliophilum fasciatum]|uniref:Uncharacterized protein n=1 Tax=Heliophilum fasciatum TaxID=35700 RepID=A0A4R2S719_9FIRM|nr:hypothetical protein [Heliophilum fasciatum]MCW2277184.1 hypothetical protein [Heliophilum fasciatum]TCP68181.1 hypothetical protein EDD73_10484 [Heliophilum fasciatum]